MIPSEIAQAIKQAGLKSLTPEALARFDTYLALLQKWNARLSLTAIRDTRTIVYRHLVESIQCAEALPEPSSGSNLLDFGSGAGLPGIPIAICRPEIYVTMAESQGKKASFLREAVRTLNLKAEVFAGRVEAMPSEQKFHLVTLRAVDKMATASSVAAERLSTRGWIVLFTTKGTEAGIKAALPRIDWKKQIPLSGLSHGSLLFGRRGE